MFCKVAFAILLKPWELPVRDFILAVYLLVPPACNLSKRWTPCQRIFKVYDHKSRKLFCQTDFSGCFLLVKGTSNGDWKNPLTSEWR